MSKAAGAESPRACATRPAALGERSSSEQVATITWVTSDGSMPASSRAARAAWVAICATVSDSAAMCRPSMPVRRRIQSSLVSTIDSRSTLVRIRSGR